MNNLQDLKRAELRAKAEEERLCKLYDCYAWEIETERKKQKHRRKEILPFIYKHMDNGLEVDSEEVLRLFRKHKAIEEETEGEMDVVLEELSADLLEDILKLFIAESKKKIKKAEGQRT